MPLKRIGAQTIVFASPPSLISSAAVGGKMEGKGPLSRYFDIIKNDSFFGEKTWEKAETVMQKLAMATALEKAGLKRSEVDCAFGGDLLNQCTSTSFAMRDIGVPFLGVYNACASFAEALLLSAALIDGGYLCHALASASSHYCTAERQYRMPMPYGNQRTPAQQWTATAAGCCVLSKNGDGPRISRATIGRIADLGISDANNMGAAMAPAALDTLTAYFHDSGETPKDFDHILTGDLGFLGREIVAEQLEKSGYAAEKVYDDCGLLLYDREKQDMHCGGSGAGCSASVFAAYVMAMMKEKQWHRVLFAPTGALLSPTSSFQGESIPSICHALVIES